MKYPARLLSSEEEIAAAFRPHWKAIILPTLISILSVAAFIVVAVSVDAPEVWYAVGGILLLWLIIALPQWIKWWFTHYVITNERLIVRRGFIARQGKEIPLEVINDVAFSQTVIERVLRSGDLLIESAGEQGQSRYSDIPDPEGVQSLIYQMREARTLNLQGKATAVEQLEILAKLHRDGVLTDEELVEKKQKLLGDI
ncbi:MAG: PH domain-containing protein [Acidimicrobiia bacterium]|nr:PH domain-containing protein [Acidimicrobiia bacterium]